MLQQWLDGTEIVIVTISNIICVKCISHVLGVEKSIAICFRIETQFSG